MLHQLRRSHIVVLEQSYQMPDLLLQLSGPFIGLHKLKLKLLDRLVILPGITANILCSGNKLLTGFSQPSGFNGRVQCQHSHLLSVLGHLIQALHINLILGTGSRRILAQIFGRRREMFVLFHQLCRLLRQPPQPIQHRFLLFLGFL